MKYLPLSSFGPVSNALNFSTPDCHIIGGCDVYTTKAAGSDKKLYRNIENSLESQYESLVRLSASLSPPYQPPSEDGKGSEQGGSRSRSTRQHSVSIPDIDLSRASPFGPLSQIGARRTFAYLIATLNASHTDYDFSHLLRPADFKKELSLRRVMHTIDSTLQNLRPNKYFSPPTTYLAPFSNSTPIINSAGNEIWSPKMWSLIDKEMGLKQCERYSWSPEEDPFEGEDGAIWSMHYFFFNKEKKRVCYLYLRGLSVISHSPVHAPVRTRPHPIQRKVSSITVGDGAGKRASYWLGSFGLQDIDTESYGPDDDDEMIIAEPGDDEVEVPDMDLDDVRSDLARGNYTYRDYQDDDADDEAYLEDGWQKHDSYVRGVSEEIEERMEL